MNYQQEVDSICTWIKKYVSNASAEGVVIGLSGGIDSALVACLCVKALGKDTNRVRGMLLPWSHDAEELAQNLGIAYTYKDNNFFEIALGIAMDLASLSTDLWTPLVLGNAKSRLRMIAFYAQANALNYLVIGTSNKTELQIGYTTKYGDGGVDFEPIGDYRKSEIYEMAKLFKDVIPENVFTKAPSADLWEGQTDEGEFKEKLGVDNYAQLEEMLISIEEGRPLTDSVPPQNIYRYISQNRHKMTIPPYYEREREEEEE